ncbi:MAG: Nif3-like dinuclear metal center hexameric protein [Lachnospiraceae bacterium]|nr:Nif3-like dinuclear metal center hexameric protein [Lachnospiraceae bacterium]
MKVREIYECLDKIAPFSYQEEWDNSGLILGDMDADVEKILVTLDVTDEVVKQAIQAKADLIISHHPLIFSPVLKINSEDFITSRILKLANGNINYIAMHTNMDTTGLSDVANELLKIKKERAIEVNINQDDKLIGIGSIGKFLNDSKEEVNISLREAVIRTKEAFGQNIVKVYGDLDRMIERVAVCTGAGKSMVEECIREKCDLLITGDITYHTALDAHERGLGIIDASHYGTEVIFVDLLRAYFELNFKDIKIIPTIQKEIGEFM